MSDNSTQVVLYLKKNLHFKLLVFYTIIIFNAPYIFRRVHISEKTLSFLNGEFEVEPGYGERREEALKMASIKTFFIIKTLKPVINHTIFSKFDRINCSSGVNRIKNKNCNCNCN